MGALSSGLKPKERLRKQAPYAPSMMNSPWAMFTTFVTPQMRFNPCAITAKTQPSSRPYVRSCKTTDQASTMVPPNGDSASGVRILDRGDRHIRRVDDLERSRLPLVHDHLVGGLDPLRADLERPKEGHEVHASQRRSDLARAQAVRVFDGLREDEDRRPGLRRVVGRRGAARPVPVE